MRPALRPRCALARLLTAAVGRSPSPVAQINTDGLFPGDANYHRSLFVFTCTSADCMGAGRAGGYEGAVGAGPGAQPLVQHVQLSHATARVSPFSAAGAAFASTGASCRRTTR